MEALFTVFATFLFVFVFLAMPVVGMVSPFVNRGHVVARPKVRTKAKEKPKTRGQALIDAEKARIANGPNLSVDTTTLTAESAVAYLSMAAADGRPRLIEALTTAGRALGDAMAAFVDDEGRARIWYALTVAFRTTVTDDDGKVTYPAVYRLAKANSLFYTGKDEAGKNVSKVAGTPARLIAAVLGGKVPSWKVATVRKAGETAGKAYARKYSLDMPGGDQARKDEPDALTIRGVLPIVREGKVVKDENDKDKTSVSSLILSDALINRKQDADVPGLRDRVAMMLAVSIRRAVMGDGDNAPDAGQMAEIVAIWTDVTAMVEKTLGIAPSKARRVA